MMYRFLFAVVIKLQLADDTTSSTSSVPHGKCSGSDSPEYFEEDDTLPHINKVPKSYVLVSICVLLVSATV
jgi:hypothetical protein